MKNEYGWGGSYPVIIGAGIDEQHDGKGITISKGIGSDKPHITLSWSQVEKRIGDLIRMDRYLNQKEKEKYPEWLEKQEERRAELAEQRKTVRYSLPHRLSLKTKWTKRKHSMNIISATACISELRSMRFCPLMKTV